MPPTRRFLPHLPRLLACLLALGVNACVNRGMQAPTELPDGGFATGGGNGTGGRGAGSGGTSAAGAGGMAGSPNGRGGMGGASGGAGIGGPSGTAGTGGAPGTAGVTGTGGLAGAGGVTATGGVAGTGGRGSGGVTGSGGQGMGGTTSAAGTTGTAGTIGAAGTTGTGGRAGTTGAAGKGGATGAAGTGAGTTGAGGTTGVGGTTGAGGTSAGGTTGAAGKGGTTGAGGSMAGAGGSVAGSSGRGGAGGTADSGGNVCPLGGVLNCSSAGVLKLSDGHVADFSPLESSSTSTKWCDADGLRGSVFFYSGASPSTANATVDTTAQNLKLNLTVGAAGYAGGGMIFDSCVTASTFTSVQFTAAVTAGSLTGCAWQVQLQTQDQRPTSDTNPSGGTCNPDAGASCYRYPTVASLAIPTAAPSAYTEAFTLFNNPSSSPVPTQTQITGIQWQVNSASSGTGTCTVELRIDNIGFQ